jgi:hypothetical protein
VEVLETSELVPCFIRELKKLDKEKAERRCGQILWNVFCGSLSDEVPECGAEQTDVFAVQCHHTVTM